MKMFDTRHKKNICVRPQLSRGYFSETRADIFKSKTDYYSYGFNYLTFGKEMVHEFIIIPSNSMTQWIFVSIKLKC